MAEDSIVEVGAVSEDGAIFTTVVRPPSAHDEAACGSSVHGIQTEELLAGPTFGTVYARMVSFFEHLQVSTTEPDDAAVVVGRRHRQQDRFLVWPTIEAPLQGQSRKSDCWICSSARVASARSFCATAPGPSCAKGKGTHVGLAG